MVQARTGARWLQRRRLVHTSRSCRTRGLDRMSAQMRIAIFQYVSRRMFGCRRARSWMKTFASRFLCPPQGPSIVGFQCKNDRKQSIHAIATGSRTADHARSRVGSLAGDCSCTSPALAATVMSKSPPARGPSAAFLGLWPIGSGRRNMLNACGGSGRAYLEIARPHNLTPVQELWYMDEGGCLTDGQCSPLEKTETVCEATWIGRDPP
ncbi:hypothetical protein L226DRAFT_162490 [Lentinus tigrinus ALCF2SS1-7]|uniref:uncharacterized protein n=1 Tax=Lentinus tigrinus ALCF2SS1-7 TaxID=1328758 RepID=UPI0011660776|nr:hypothetical protein L226DRAFT_162490 [Lentinus tigrinus ALCF2SS1-7]